MECDALLHEVDDLASIEIQLKDKLVGVEPGLVDLVANTPQASLQRIDHGSEGT